MFPDLKGQSRLVTNRLGGLLGAARSGAVCGERFATGLQHFVYTIVYWLDMTRWRGEEWELGRRAEL